MVEYHGLLNENRLLEHRFIFGFYPEVITHPGEERDLLKLLVDSFLYKDFFFLEEVTKPILFEKILKALALQLGSEVSFNELNRLTGANHQTVEKYIALLEKAFVIFRLPAFSRNVRNQVRKGESFTFMTTVFAMPSEKTSNFPDSVLIWDHYGKIF